MTSQRYLTPLSEPAALPIDPSRPLSLEGGSAEERLSRDPSRATTRRGRTLRPPTVPPGSLRRLRGKVVLATPAPAVARAVRDARRKSTPRSTSPANACQSCMPFHVSLYFRARTASSRHIVAWALGACLLHPCLDSCGMASDREVRRLTAHCCPRDGTGRFAAILCVDRYQTHAIG